MHWSCTSGKPKPAFPVPKQSIWTGPLANGSFTAVLFNADTVTANITLAWTMLDQYGGDSSNDGGSTAQGYLVRDLWQHQDLGVLGGAGHTWAVPPHDVVFLKIRKAAVTSP